MVLKRLLFGLAKQLHAWAFRFNERIHTLYKIPFVGVSQISFEDPFGNGNYFEDPLHNFMEFDWNEPFMGFLWENGYNFPKADVEKVRGKEDWEDMQSRVVDIWLLDCYRNALFEYSQQNSFVQESPTEPGFTKRTRNFRRWDAMQEEGGGDYDGYLQDEIPTTEFVQEARTVANAEKTWPGGTERTLGRS